MATLDGGTNFNAATGGWTTSSTSEINLSDLNAAAHKPADINASINGSTSYRNRMDIEYTPILKLIYNVLC